MTNPLEAMSELIGGCRCGRARYRATGHPFHATSCHCSVCRHVSGAAFVTWFSIQRAEFAWIAGRVESFGSSDHGTLTSCPRCSTPLTFQQEDYPDELDVTLSSLDDPRQLAPREHAYVSTRLAWVQLSEASPRLRSH